MTSLALTGYLLFVASWFTHLTARVAILGVIRFDLLLVAILAFAAFSKNANKEGLGSRTDQLLRVLLIYVILTIPFVEWPGSVLKMGLPNWIKAAVFYYFTVAFVRTEQDLRKFIYVFIGCQVFRVLEPLYLHLTDGYWGSQASMAGGDEFLSRLSGAPSDVVNPNGLAYVICTVLPFLYFLAPLSAKHRIAAIIVIPAALYALSLTGSRSGIIGLVIIFLGILIKSKHRATLSVVAIVGATVGFSFMSPDVQDRYLSIVGKGEKNTATADERFEGMRAQMSVIWHRPIFGHGLGTSAEANYHFTTAGPYGGRAVPAHNLYLEIAQELGLVGLVIFLLFLQSIVSAFFKRAKIRGRQPPNAFMPKLMDAMQVWLAMSLVFSFASYGLSSYDWYLFAGLSVITQRLILQAQQQAKPAAANEVTGRRALPHAGRRVSRR